MKTLIPYTIILLITFLSSNSSFSQTQIGQDIDGETTGDESGRYVSFSSDGNRVAIGAPRNDESGTDAGAVSVYEMNGGNWIQVGTDIDGESVGDESGRSVALSENGNRVAIGARANDGNGLNGGHARIFDWDGTSWIQAGGDINSEAAEDNFGESLSLSSNGNRVAIGAPFNDGNGSDAGHVRVFDWDGMNWTQVGTDIDGEESGDLSGRSISLSPDGSRVAIGAMFNDGLGIVEAGQVRVYEMSGGTWVQVGADIDGEASLDRSGRSVALSENGSRVAIGADANDGNGFNSGHVRVYDWDGASWMQVGADIDGEASLDRFGFSVSLTSDGNRMAVGSSHNSGNGFEAGQVRVYNWDGMNWTQVGTDIDGEAEGDRSGRSVSLSSDGSRLVIGAPFNDGNGMDSGHARVYGISLVSSITSQTKNNIRVFPNPTIGVIQISGIDNGIISVIDNLGRVVLKRKQTQLEMDLSELLSGVYFIQIKSDRQLITKKLIKK